MKRAFLNSFDRDDPPPIQSPVSSIKTRSPLKVFIVFALGIILPGGFLSYLGLRSFQYEGMLMQKRTEEHFSSAADLMQKKAEQRLQDLIDALGTIARNDAVRRMRLPELLPLMISTSKLNNLPVQALYAFDNQEQMVAPWRSPEPASGQERIARGLDWGPLRDEIDRIEHLEFVEKRIDQAIQGYQSLQSLTLPEPLQAALLKNIAGNFRKLRQNHPAEMTYQKLIRNFDQLPDFSGYPMGILGLQLLIKMYEEDKAWDRVLDTRLDLYDGLLLKRWSLPDAQRAGVLQDLRKSIPQTISLQVLGLAERRARWERLQTLERQWEQRRPAAAAFAKQAWPDLLRRLRGRGWLDQGGVLQWEGPGDQKHVVVTAPIAAPDSERRSGLLVAVLPAEFFWPLIDQSFLELAQPVGLDVDWDYSGRQRSSVNKSADALRKARLRRTVGRIDPPLHFELREANAQEQTQLFRRRRWIYGGMVGLSVIVILVGLVAMRKAVQREMEVANLKADFVATVSHELRTPLAAISHIGERLSLGRYRSEEERNEFYDLLGKETFRLRGLIEDILDFSKMLAGRKVYKREPVQAVTLVQEALESFEGKAEARGFNVALDLPQEDLVIAGDWRALLQALLNLLDNALKYSGGSNTIDVRLWRAGERCRIEVRDYGIGIPESEKERIFEKFYRIENAMSHASESGVGLGLALVKHVVEGHQGVIRVASVLGQGSTFILDFPLVSGGLHGSNTRY